MIVDSPYLGVTPGKRHAYRYPFGLELDQGTNKKDGRGCQTANRRADAEVLDHESLGILPVSDIAHRRSSRGTAQPARGALSNSTALVRTRPCGRSVCHNLRYRNAQPLTSLDWPLPLRGCINQPTRHTRDCRSSLCNLLVPQKTVCCGTCMCKTNLRHDWATGPCDWFGLDAGALPRRSLVGREIKIE